MGAGGRGFEGQKVGISAFQGLWVGAASGFDLSFNRASQSRQWSGCWLNRRAAHPDRIRLPDVSGERPQHEATEIPRSLVLEASATSNSWSIGCCF